MTTVCRICFEEDSPENMIIPCKCKGSSKYVHRSCLDSWRNVDTTSPNFTRCNTCLFQYVYDNKHNKEKIKKYRFNILYDIFFVILAIFMFGIVIFMFISVIDLKKESKVPHIVITLAIYIVYFYTVNSNRLPILTIFIPVFNVSFQIFYILFYMLANFFYINYVNIKKLSKQHKLRIWGNSQNNQVMDFTGNEELLVS